MYKKLPILLIALRIWFLTNVFFSVVWYVYFVFSGQPGMIFTAVLAFIAGSVLSLPVMVILFVSIGWLGGLNIVVQRKITITLSTIFICCLMYGVLGASFLSLSGFDIGTAQQWILNTLYFTAALFGSALAAYYCSRQKLLPYFSLSNQKNISFIQKNNMETTTLPGQQADDIPSNLSSNKILIKGLITGALILAMMIPTVFITGLVTERENRQREVASEVSAKWAGAQTLTGPFLYIPYKVTLKDKDNKPYEVESTLWLLPENLQTKGTLEHQIRQRSIYKVLLYKAGLHDSGNFKLQLPSDISPASVQWANVKICFELSDFKGIEERMAIHFNGKDYEFSPGLPGNDPNAKGLSASVLFSPEDIGNIVPFEMNIKLKGSGFLHFIPLAGNSDYTIQSGWNHPSFDGNNLPTERALEDNGFNAHWTFNKANLPFGTSLRDLQFDKGALAFGVTMLQPADQYAKTSRSVKYAILIMGLSFSLFFIVELMQKKPIHPVQYVLIGLALVIFYTLLLSISEFLLFDISYGIAAGATILLISFYAWSHFHNWRPAGIFAAVLTLLYGFIFILIRLEDTALLVGSIGLFAILSLVMYASRNINWYGHPKTTIQGSLT